MASLSGRRVIVTREDPGALGDLLAARGAEMLHVPTIVTEDPPDGGDALRRELSALADGDWLVATSPEGARRVAPAAHTPGLRLAAVGTATARVLEAASGRAVDVVPDTQKASTLAEAIVATLASASSPARRPRILVAQADRAGGELARTVRAAGHDVVTVVAYRTSVVAPAGVDAGRVDAGDIDAADAILFASGSAVEGWVTGIGLPLPPIVIAIGPSTAAVAADLGVPVSATAAVHSLEGLVSALEDAVAPDRGSGSGPR